MFARSCSNRNSTLPSLHYPIPPRINYSSRNRPQLHVKHQSNQLQETTSKTAKTYKLHVNKWDDDFSIPGPVKTDRRELKDKAGQQKCASNRKPDAPTHTFLDDLSSRFYPEDYSSFNTSWDSSGDGGGGD